MTYPQGKVPRSLLPHYFRHPLVKGVFNGGCVARGVGSSFHASAHAHAGEDEEFFGWICYRAGRKIDLEMLALHEIAHLVAGKGHTDEWRRVVLSLGGTLDPAPSLKSYQKQRRDKNMAKKVKKPVFTPKPEKEKTAWFTATLRVEVRLSELDEPFAESQVADDIIMRLDGTGYKTGLIYDAMTPTVKREEN